MLIDDGGFEHLDEVLAFGSGADEEVVAILDVEADLGGEFNFQVDPLGLVGIGNIAPVALVLLDYPFGKAFLFNGDSSLKDGFSSCLEM